MGLRRKEDLRPLGLVTAYWICLGLAYFNPQFRHPAILIAACVLSFLNAVVIHNEMHVPIFRSRPLRSVFRALLSFGNLYPASANIPSHNRVHHRFEDDGLPDWAEPNATNLSFPLLTLIHFPNVVGPRTFKGVSRFCRRLSSRRFTLQYRFELLFALGLTAILLAFDFWPALLFVVVPQLFGARWILRINLLQHEGTDKDSEFNHSRNFMGRVFNWFMMNNGFHAVHHKHPSLHWSELPAAHARLMQPVDPRLEEPSFFMYLARDHIVGRRP